MFVECSRGITRSLSLARARAYASAYNDRPQDRGFSNSCFLDAERGERFAFSKSGVRPSYRLVVTDAPQKS